MSNQSIGPTGNERKFQDSLEQESLPTGDRVMTPPPFFLEASEGTSPQAGEQLLAAKNPSSDMEEGELTDESELLPDASKGPIGVDGGGSEENSNQGGGTGTPASPPTQDSFAPNNTELKAANLSGGSAEAGDFEMESETSPEAQAATTESPAPSGMPNAAPSSGDIGNLSDGLGVDQTSLAPPADFTPPALTAREEIKTAEAVVIDTKSNDEQFSTKTPDNGSVEAPIQRSRSNDPPANASTNLPFAARNFINELVGKKQSILDTVISRREAILAAAHAQKNQIHHNFEATYQSAAQAYNGTVQQIQSSSAAARTKIAEDNQRRVENIIASDGVKMQDMNTAFNNTRQAILDSAYQKAEQARTHGIAEAERVNKGVEIAALRAPDLGALGRFEGFRRARRISNVTMAMGFHAAGEFRKVRDGDSETGEIGAYEAIIQDTSALMNKFPAEANQVVAQMETQRQPAAYKVRGETEQAIQLVNQASEVAYAKVDEAEAQAYHSLAPLTLNAEHLVPVLDKMYYEIDGLVEASFIELNNQSETAFGEIDAVIGEVASQLGGADENQAQNEVDRVRESILGGVQGIVSHLHNGGNAVIGKISEMSGISHGPLKALIDMTAGLVKMGSDYEGVINRILAEIKTALDANMGHFDREAGTGNGGAFAQALNDALSKCNSEWGNELSIGKQSISQKANDTLAKVEEGFAKLDAEIIARATEIENQSWLDRTIEFFIGLTKGFLKAMLDAVFWIVAIALAVLAIVVVVAALVMMIGGWAAILAIAVFVAANAAFFASVVTIVGTVATIVGLATAGFSIYQAAVRDDLSDQERGKFAGQALFDIIETFFGDYVYGSVADLAKGMKLSNRAADVGNLGDAARTAETIRVPNPIDEVAPGGLGRVANPGQELTNPGPNPARIPSEGDNLGRTPSSNVVNETPAIRENQPGSGGAIDHNQPATTGGSVPQDPTVLLDSNPNALDDFQRAGLTQEAENGQVVFRNAESGREVARVTDQGVVYNYEGYGGDITMDPDNTTTLLGRFEDYTVSTADGRKTGTNNFLSNDGLSVTGANPGGANILNTGEWTPQLNWAWLVDSISRGDEMKMISDPSNPMTYWRQGTKESGYSVTAHEIAIMVSEGKLPANVIPNEVASNFDELLPPEYIQMRDSGVLDRIRNQELTGTDWTLPKDHPNHWEAQVGYGEN